MERSRTKKLSASGGLRPLTPYQGLCPWTPLGAPPPDPVIGSRSTRSPWPRPLLAPPTFKHFQRPCKRFVFYLFHIFLLPHVSFTLSLHTVLFTVYLLTQLSCSYLRYRWASLCQVLDTINENVEAVLQGAEAISWKFCGNLNIFHGDTKGKVSGCFFSEHSVLAVWEQSIVVWVVFVPYSIILPTYVQAR